MTSITILPSFYIRSKTQRENAGPILWAKQTKNSLRAAHTSPDVGEVYEISHFMIAFDCLKWTNYRCKRNVWITWDQHMNTKPHLSSSSKQWPYSSWQAVKTSGRDLCAKRRRRRRKQESCKQWQRKRKKKRKEVCPSSQMGLGLPRTEAASATVRGLGRGSVGFLPQIYQ